MSRLLLRRIAALGPGAPEPADALSILGDGATLAQATRLAAVQDGVAAAADDALEQAGITRDLSRSCTRSHAPRSTTTSRERLARHREAARIVHGDGVAAQRLLAGPPDAWAVEQLRAAARRALARGAPDHAAACLRHALDGPAERSTILLELGPAKATAQDARAVAHLRRRAS